MVLAASAAGARSIAARADSGPDSGPEPDSPLTPPSRTQSPLGSLPLLTPPMSAPLLVPVSVVEVRLMERED
jgi:hypothetical protein